MKPPVVMPQSPGVQYPPETEALPPVLLLACSTKPPLML
jgi:hypothetical protein